MSYSLSKLPCVRCGRKGRATWNICADKNRKRRVCRQCDVELNTMVMRWAFGNSREADIKKYRKKVLG